MSDVKTRLELLGGEWHRLKANLENHEQALANHLKSDWVATKSRLEAGIEHYREMFEAVEAKLPAVTVERLKNGESVVQAVDAHLNPPAPAVAAAAVEVTG